MQNTKQIIMFEPLGKKTTLVGTSPSSILALHVTRKGLRKADIQRKKTVGVADLEQGECIEEATDFIIAVVDENEVISIFDTSIKSVKEPVPIA